MTQPLDVIKTRMQSLEARKEYKNSFACAARIFRDEGVLTFWSGAVPRLARLILSGGIVFTMCVYLSLVFFRWDVTVLGANMTQVRGDDEGLRQV